jgi:hypothetical protein
MLRTLALLLFTLVCACDHADLVAGRTLRLKSQEGAAALVGAKVVLRFTDREVGAWAGCNQVSGVFVDSQGAP